MKLILIIYKFQRKNQKNLRKKYNNNCISIKISRELFKKTMQKKLMKFKKPNHKMNQILSKKLIIYKKIFLKLLKIIIKF